MTEQLSLHFTNLPILELHIVKSLSMFCSVLWPLLLTVTPVQGFCLQCRRPQFDSCVGKIPWRRERLPFPAFWPGEFHGLYRPWGHKESDMTKKFSFPHLCNLPYSFLLVGSISLFEYIIYWYMCYPLMDIQCFQLGTIMNKAIWTFFYIFCVNIHVH